MVEPQLPKLMMRVRFPLPAPLYASIYRPLAAQETAIRLFSLKYFR